jgi:hypothetical protein
METGIQENNTTKSFTANYQNNLHHMAETLSFVIRILANVGVPSFQIVQSWYAAAVWSPDQICQHFKAIQTI